MKNVLITGANGQLGSEFKKIKKNTSKFRFYFTDILELDITNFSKIEKYVKKHKIDIILNTAAYTDVTKAELEKNKADMINEYGIENLVKLSEKYAMKLIHYSTDYVYTGKNKTPIDETHTTNPLNYYGLSKRKGELIVQKSSSESIIIRTSWLYSSFGSNFVNTILQKAKKEKKINVINDQFGCPTYAKDLAIDTIKILKSNLKLDFDGKIYNYSNLGFTNWSEFAKQIIEISNLKCKVNEVSSSSYKSTVDRPMFSITNKNKITKNFKLIIPHWKKSLKNYLSK